MAHIFKLITPIQKIADGGDVLKISGYASTSDTDRVGDVIVPDAWMKGGLDNFKKNPIILFNHNYGKPIGKATELEVDSRGLKITCEISKSDPGIHTLIKDGVLTTFSVGFMIKEADYNDHTDGYIIRNAELLEVSVVSVPCNQEAVFSISKSLNPEELKEFRKETLGDNSEDEVKTSTTDEPEDEDNSNSSYTGTIEMDEQKILELAQKIAAESEAKRVAAEKAAAEEKARKEADEARIKEETEKAVASVTATVLKTSEEKLTAAFEEKLKENNDNWVKTVEEMKGELAAKSEELTAMMNSKRSFSDRSGGSTDLTKDKEFMSEAKDAYILGVLNKTKTFETAMGKQLIEKFNTHSTVTVGDDALETSVRTDIERDIWNELILAPLFREIRMNSATMTFPIMPDAGYAEATTNTAASGTQPNGNMDQRGAGYGAPYQGITLSNQTLTTTKLITKSYLGNETEEDAIMPILPLIRESMVRAHARGVENMLLAGNTNQGVYTSGVADGLLKFASTNGRTVTTAGVSTPLTGAALFGLRKLMGKYGLNPRDVVYIVSQQAYFELIEDAEFADADLVGAQANKLTGEVGRLYGSTVVMCDEFATPGANNYLALAVNRRNFIVPRLRDMRVESEYQVEEQRTALVASQRLGFAEIIPNATSVVGLKYAAS